MLSQHNSKLQEQQNKLNAHQVELDKIVDNIKKTVSALKSFKEKLDGLKHISDIDKMWSDCKTIHNEVRISRATVLSETSAGVVSSKIGKPVMQSTSTWFL